jgi:hypothetical protein
MKILLVKSLQLFCGELNNTYIHTEYNSYIDI